MTTDSLPGFVHLHVHSDHSKLDSIARAGALCAAAAADNQPALASTDHGSLTGIWQFAQAARKAGIKPICGMEAYLSFGSRFEKFFIEVDADSDSDAAGGAAGSGRKRKAYMHLTLLAATRKGWLNLVAMHNAAQDSVWYEPRIDFDLLREHAEGVIVLTGCLGGPVAGPLSRGDAEGALAAAQELVDIVGRDNVFVEVMDHAVPAEQGVMDDLFDLADVLGLRAVATNDCHYVHAEDADAHDAWLCTATGATVSDQKRFRFQGSGYYLKSAAEMAAVRPGDPRWLAACANTLVVADMVEDWVLPEQVLRLPKFPLPAGYAGDAASLLRERVRAGALARFASVLDADGRPPADVAARLNSEVSVISSMGYDDYFLMTADLIDWARSDRGVPCPEWPDGQPGAKKPILAGPGRGCVTGDTLVVTSEGVKPIPEVRIGDLVLSHTGMWRTVTNRFVYEVPQSEQMVFIRAASGAADSPGVTMTADHKVAVLRVCEATGTTSTEWVPAGDVTTGDLLVRPTQDKTPGGVWLAHPEAVEVRPVEPSPGSRMVYDLQVEVDHSFTTDGFVVHNSAAGSLVSYCLGIVDVDPLVYGLLFERFLEPGRAGMPDIDIDFEQERRSELVDYLVARYGGDYVALIGTFGIVRSKQAVKDAARVLGLPPAVANKLTALIPVDQGKPASLSDMLDEAFEGGTEFRRELDNNEDSARVVALARSFEGVVRSLSTHACGVLVSAEPLGELGIPLRWERDGDAKTGVAITCWDGADVSDDGVGLLKMDALVLRNLDIIASTLTTVEELTGERVTFDSLPDPDGLANGTLDPESVEGHRVRAAWDLLCAGHTSGCFQLESRGITELTTQVLPRTLEDLSAIMALYRPGPMGANSHGIFVENRFNPAAGSYDRYTTDPVEADALGTVLDVTERTFVYQEQVMRLGDVVAGFDAKQRSALRKAVAKKNPEALRKVGEAWFAGATRDVVREDGSVSQAFSRETAEKLWADFQGCASYLFNKCVTGDTVVETPDGVAWTVADLYDAYATPEQSPRALPAELLAYDFAGHTIAAKPLAGVHDNGVAEVFEVVLSDGSTIRATANHRFLKVMVGWGGEWTTEWVSVARLEPGLTRLATRAMSQRTNRPLPEHAVVVSVTAAGRERVFDVEMDDEGHNFVANGFISHNSHSVAYAKLGFLTAFLKANWPTAFAAATLMHTPRGDKRDALLPALAGDGVQVLAPAINSSKATTTADPHGRLAVTLGLSEIKDVGKAAYAIVAERDARGLFTSVADLVDRVRVPSGDGVTQGLSASAVEALIVSGALDEFGPRRGLMAAWRAQRTGAPVLVPDVEWDVLEAAARQREVLGVITGAHPLTDPACVALLRSWVVPDRTTRWGDPIGRSLVSVAQVVSGQAGGAAGGQPVFVAGVLAAWDVKATKSGMRANLRLEGSSSVISGVAWPSTMRGLASRGVTPAAGDLVAVLGRPRESTRVWTEVDESGVEVERSEARRELSVDDVWVLTPQVAAAVEAGAVGAGSSGLAVDFASLFTPPVQAAAVTGQDVDPVEVDSAASRVAPRDPKGVDHVGLAGDVPADRPPLGLVPDEVPAPSLRVVHGDGHVLPLPVAVSRVGGGGAAALVFDQAGVLLRGLDAAGLLAGVAGLLMPETFTSGARLDAGRTLVWLVVEPPEFAAIERCVTPSEVVAHLGDVVAGVVSADRGPAMVGGVDQVLSPPAGPAADTSTSVLKVTV